MGCRRNRSRQVNAYYWFLPGILATDTIGEFIYWPDSIAATFRSRYRVDLLAVAIQRRCNSVSRRFTSVLVLYRTSLDRRNAVRRNARVFARISPRAACDIAENSIPFNRLLRIYHQVLWQMVPA